MNNIKALGTDSVLKLLLKYSIPAVIAMLVNAVYNVVDRVFIGQFVGEDALAALTVAFPIMMILFAFASLIGSGGSSLMSIKLGENDIRGANHVFANTISFGVIVAGVMLGIIYLNLDKLLGMFGATSIVVGHATVYISIIFGGFIFQMLSFILSSFVRTEGKPLLSMIAMITSALVNIVLDFIFIVLFDFGVAGAAYATIIGQFTGLCMILSYYFRGRSQLTLNLKDLLPDVKLIVNIVSIGFATFISTLGTSVAMMFMNISLSHYGGTAAITAMGAINSLFTFFIMPIMGITQGMQPIIGYNHGARNRDRVTKTLKYGIAIGSIFSISVFGILELFPTLFVNMFLTEGSSTTSIAVNGLRVYIAMLPVLSINIMGVAYFQSIAKGNISVALGMLRQFVVLLPLLFILPRFLGLNGVWLSVPIADGIAVLISCIVLVKELNNKENEWYKQAA